MGQIPLNIKPPLGGIVNRTAYQDKPPFTAYSAVNMWPIDALTGRAVYATRPLLTSVFNPGGFTTLLQPVNGIVSMKPVRSLVVAIDGQVYWYNSSGGFTASTGAEAGDIATDRPVYAATAYTYVIIANRSGKPLVFDYTDGSTTTMTETAGTVPDDATIAVFHQGCVWLVIDNRLVCSRTGDPLDYDFSAPLTDQGGATDLSSGEHAGKINGPISALMPQTTDTMLVSTVGGGIQALRAHPRRGGEFFPKSPDNLYALGQGAWAKDRDGTVYILTEEGLVSIGPDPTAIVVPVSTQPLPEELRGLTYEYDNPVVSMVYDSRWNGIHIKVRGAENQAWWYDLSLGGFHREEYNVGYPYVMTEFAPFITESTSGVVFGGVGLNILDKFGTESVESGVVIGPVKISENVLRKNEITKMRTVYGRDTPKDGEGTLTISVGADGQDAIDRLLNNDYQVSTDLSLATANFGMVYPKVSGHAAVFSYNQTSGSLAIEEIEVTLNERGLNRIPRSPQIAVEGEAISFTAPSNDFDEDVWLGYSQLTPGTPNCTLVDHTLFVDLSLLPGAWWAVTNSDGSDIRATDNNNNSIPLDLIEFDQDAETGFAAMKVTQQNPPTPVRLWSGNTLVGGLAADGTYGQYNAYDSNWAAFYPSGGGTDRTSNANDLTMNNATAGDSTGPMGNTGTNYGPNNTNWYGVATAAIPSTYPITLVTAFNRTTSQTSTRGAVGVHNTTPTQHQLISPGRSSSPADAAFNQTASVNGGTTGSVNSTTVSNAFQWLHYAGVISAVDARTSYVSGGNDQNNTTSVTTTGLNEIVVGKGSRSGLSSLSVQGVLSVTSVHDTARTACWVEYQNQMMDQVTFWTTVSDFVEVNDPPTPDDPGGGEPTEVGTWSGYATATPIAPNSNLNNFTHWVDLSRLPTEWWAAVDSTGVDIRATDGANQFLPLDLINFDSTAETGFAAVQQTQTVTAPREIRLWVGNGSAITVPVDATYGQYATYDTGYEAFYPEGGGDDRTRRQRNLTAVGSPTVGGATGAIGVGATSYDGSTQYAYNLNSRFITYPTVVAVSKTSELVDTESIVSLNTTQFTGHFSLIHIPDPAPTRLRITSLNKSVDTYSVVTEAVDSFHHALGFAANGVTRGVSVNGNAIASPQSKKSFANSPNAHIGAQYIVTVGARMLSTTPTAKEFFNGDIMLVQVHNTPRALDNAFANYQNAMLTQATFWDSDWTWVAETSSLPQS